MTSKNLFFKRMKQDLEQRIWLPVVFFIISFLTMELPLISRLDQWKGKEELIDNYLLNYYFAPELFFTAISIGVAALSALSGFIYMHSGKKLDVYHSIPVKRETLFLQQYVYGILYYLVPLVLHIIISIGICAAKGVFGAAVFGQSMGFMLMHILIYLACYSVVITAVCLTGNLVISVLGSGVLLLYSLILSLLKASLMSQFFTTYYYTDSEFEMWAFSPLHLFIKMADAISIRNGNLVYTDYMGYYVKFFVMAVIYTVIALVLYRKRPTEVAGRSMAFSITEPVVKTMVVFPTTIVSGYLFASFSTSSSNEFGWFVFGCIFGFMIVCPVMEMIFRKDIKAVLSHPLQIVFNGACVICVILILHFDVLGYDSYIPDEDKVESYVVSIEGCSNIYTTGESVSSYPMDNMTIIDNESTRKLLEHAAELTRPVRKGKLDAEAQAGEALYGHLEVKYNLKNGREVYRNYWINIADEQVMQWLADTYNDIQYKLGTYPVFAENREKNYASVLLDYAYASEPIPLSEEKMQKFVETYRRELTNLSMEEVATEYPVASLDFALECPEEEYYGIESGYKIYPSFTQTIALLEEYGADIVNEIPAEDVISIWIEDYSEEVYDYDGFYTKLVEVEYTAQAGQTEEIAQILPNLMNNQLDIDFYTGETVEPCIDVRVTYNYDGKEMEQYLRFKKDMMPEFVIQDIKEAAQ